MSNALYYVGAILGAIAGFLIGRLWEETSQEVKEAALRGTKPDSVTITLPNNSMCAIVRKVDGHYEIDTGRVEKWPEVEE